MNLVLVSARVMKQAHTIVSVCIQSGPGGSNEIKFGVEPPSCCQV